MARDGGTGGMAREELRFEPVSKRLVSEEIARRISDAVRAGKLRKGDRLPSERALAEQFGVSRPTIREAGRLLVEAGLVTIRPGAQGGMIVASEYAPYAFLGSEPRLRPGEMFEILELRRLILPWVAQEAASYANDDDFDRMHAAVAFGRQELQRLATAPFSADSAELIVTASARFDLALAQATGNSLVLRLMDMLLRWLAPLRLMTLERKDDLVPAIDVVEQTLAALESGDRAKVAEVIEYRLQVLERALEQRSGRMPRAKRRA
ncbi:MAG: FadR family transcriptional regulator [Rhizobiales bacterium]|nr:FadR family transcriptional regulator [Hyphomicrobiales bacterium]